MDCHNSDTDTEYFDSVFCFSCLQQEHTAAVISAPRASAAVRAVIGHLQGYRWDSWYEVPIVTNLRPGTNLWARLGLLSSPTAINFQRGIMGSFGRTFSPWLEGARTTWALLQGLHANTEPRIRPPPLSSVTVSARRLTWCQAQVLRWLSSSQSSRQARSRLWQEGSVGSGWVQTLRWPLCPPVCCLPSGVGTCSKRGGKGRKKKKKKQPCLLLPLPDRNQKLTMLGFKTPQPDLEGPEGLPRTDWSLTMA